MIFVFVNYPFNMCSLGLNSLTYTQRLVSEWVLTVSKVISPEKEPRDTDINEGCILILTGSIFGDLTKLFTGRRMLDVHVMQPFTYNTMDHSLIQGLKACLSDRQCASAFHPYPKRWLQSYRITDLGTKTWHITHFSRREWDWG